MLGNNNYILNFSMKWIDIFLHQNKTSEKMKQQQKQNKDIGATIYKQINISKMCYTSVSCITLPQIPNFTERMLPNLLYPKVLARYFIKQVLDVSLLILLVTNLLRVVIWQSERSYLCLQSNEELQIQYKNTKFLRVYCYHERTLKLFQR